MHCIWLNSYDAMQTKCPNYDVREEELKRKISSQLAYIASEAVDEDALIGT